MTSEPETRHSQLNILLVEDDPSDAGLIHELLAGIPGRPIQLRRVERLAAALGELASRGIDAVLLDLNLPDSRGLETFTRVYAHAPGTPIIVLTGVADETLGLEAVRSGAQDYLVKGRVDGPRLIRAIRYAIERKRAERAIPDTKEFYEQLVGQAGDAIVVLDPHGIVLTWNAGAERMFGWTAAEVLGGSYPTLHPPEVATQINQNIRRIVAGETLINAEIRRLRKDGTWLDALLTASPVRGPSGDVIAVQSIIKDITERKRIEGDRLRLAAMLEATSDFVGIADPQGRTIYINRAGRRMLGIGEDEDVVGKDIAGYHPAWAADIILREGIPRAIRDGTWICETALQHPAGREIPVSQLILAHRAPDGSLEFLSTIARDITDRKQAEREIALLAKFPSEDPNPVLRIAQDGTILFANEASLPLLGAWQCRQGGVMPPEWRQIIPEILGDGRRNEMEVVCEGRTFTLTLAPVAEGAYVNVYALDITERKKAEEALRASARQLAEAQRIGHLGSWEWDFATNELHWSRETYRIFGLAPQEFGGTYEAFLAAVHPADREEVMRAADDARKRGTDYTMDYRVVRPEGTERMVRAHWEVQLDDNSRPVRMVGTVHDTTDQKQADEALRESERRLRKALEELKATQQQVLQQERLRALGQMASGIAHDFNNALSPIMGFSELLLDVPQHLSDRDKATRYLKIINIAAKDAASIVRRLREFYRTRDEDEHLIPISLNQIARHAISLTQPRWKDQALAAGITVRIATDLQTVPLVVANESEIREALLNLIFNAVDAMPQGGTITIRTRSRDGSAELEVSDTGTGMTEEVRGRCLEPFFSTKGEHGTGLGLAMVYGIIERHHGRIDIDSEPGRGTTVTLRLPVEAEPEVKDKTQEAVAPSRRCRILVVDDEPLMCEVLTEYLTRDGHTVETAANGREGLEKFHRDWFDVVITDRGMPEMSGDQMAASIKRTAPTKPVILLTGFGDLILAAGEKPAGIDSVISKPVTAAALRKALADIIP